MLQRRTDLAVEARELRAQGDSDRVEGVEMAQGEREGYPVTTVHVTTQQGAEQIGKPVGTYLTLELAGLKRREADAFPRAARALCAALGELLPLKPGEGALVVGLGNRAITPDNIGPEAARHTLATRHLTAQVPEHFGHLRPVSVLCPGVLAQTGMESGELVRAAVDALRPACVLAVDALASRSLKRVCSTVQLSDTGITPGSGVGNHRTALDRETLGVPVIAIGAPTVVDVATLCADVLAEAGMGDLEPEALRDAAPGLLVTPRDIDQSAADLAKVIGFGVNLALQDSLCLEDIELLLS
jgi:spore protease